MPRNDPTDNGGLFIGRRPGTAPLKYKTQPKRSGDRRQRRDGMLARLVLGIEVLLVLTAWGPQPAAWLWVGSQVDYHSGSVMLGLAVAFIGLLASLMATLAVAAQLDGLWRILRRAAGHDQKEGVLARVFMWTAILATVAFGFWFLVIQGPGPSLAPNA
jgi:predicted secreted protein